MSYNKKELKVISTAKGKQNPYAKDRLYIPDIPVDPMGMWNSDNWGNPVTIPGNSMATNGYGNMPLYVVPDVGDPRMIQPNSGDQYFPEASSFTEYPQPDEEMRYGGLKRNKRKTSKNIFTSVNDLFRRNETLYGKPGRRFYDPNYKEQGGTMNNNYFQAGGLSRSDDFGSKSNPYPSVSSEDFAGGGRSYPIPTKADAIDALRLAGLHNRSDVRAKIFAKYPDLRKEFGGELSAFIHSIAKKQFGGMDEVGSASPATSIDSITGEKKNFFNNYIRNNVSKAMADQLQQEMMNQHMMPDGSMMAGPSMQTGGQYGIDGYTPLSTSDSIAVTQGLAKPMMDINKWNYNVVDNSAKRGNVDDQMYRTNVSTGAKTIVPTGAWNKPTDIMIYKEQMRRSAEAQGQPSPYPAIFWQGNEGVPITSRQMGGSDPFGPTPECSEIDKKTPGHACYIPGYLGLPVAGSNTSISTTPAENPNAGYNFMTDVNKDNAQNQNFGPPYEQQQTPFNKQNEYGQSLNNTGNNPLDMGDNTKSQEESYNATAPNTGSSFSVSFDGRKTADALIGGMNMVSSFLEGRDRRKQEKKRNLSGDAIFQPMPEQSGSRGDYDPNSGMFRPNQMVPIQYAGTNYGNIGSNMYAQYGGPIDENDEGVYMDENEIAQILAMGGTITYLD